MYETNFCRICITSKNNLIRIDAVDDGLSLFEKLVSCTPEIMYEETQMYKLICNECCRQLKISYDFRQLCLRSKELLQGYVLRFKNLTKEENEELLQSVTLKEDQIKKEIDNHIFHGINTEINKDSTFVPTQINFTQGIIKQECLNDCEFTKESVENGLREEYIKHDESELTGEFNINASHFFLGKTNLIPEIPLITKESVITHYCCDMCTKVFTSKHHFKRHSLTHSKDKKYKCTICEKGFLTSNSLSSHKRVHTTQKPHSCPNCDKVFKKQYDLKIHSRVHTGEKPHVCRFCRRGFSGLTRLKRHESIHTGTKPYVCNVCGKSFVEPGNLSVHKRIHTGEKPYVCPICDRGFIQMSALTKHNLVHTGEKPYFCKFCNKRFTARNNLRRHEIIHSDFRPYFCEVCDKRFNNRSYLARHFRSHSKEGLEVVRTYFGVKLADKSDIHDNFDLKRNSVHNFLDTDEIVIEKQEVEFGEDLKSEIEQMTSN